MSQKRFRTTSLQSRICPVCSSRGLAYFETIVDQETCIDPRQIILCLFPGAPVRERTKENQKAEDKMGGVSEPCQAAGRLCLLLPCSPLTKCSLTLPHSCGKEESSDYLFFPFQVLGWGSPRQCKNLISLSEKYYEGKKPQR